MSYYSALIKELIRPTITSFKNIILIHFNVLDRGLNVKHELEFTINNGEVKSVFDDKILVTTGQKRELAFKAIAVIGSTDPEIVSVGMTIQEVKDKDINIKTVKLSFIANGRALSQQLSLCG